MATSKRSDIPLRRPYHHGNLRRALLDEALVTIREEGVDGLTLREIGARVGVSRSALYRHFADKRALLTAVATEGFRALRQQLVAAWGSWGPTLSPHADRMAFVSDRSGRPELYVQSLLGAPATAQPTATLAETSPTSPNTSRSRWLRIA